MNMRVDTASGENLAFACNDVGSRSDHDVDAGLNIGITGLADPRNTTILDTDIGFDDAPIVQNDDIGDNQIDSFGRGPLSLPHTVADDLAAAEGYFFAVDTAIFLDLDDELGIRQTQTVTLCRAIQFGIGLS